MNTASENPYVTKLFNCVLHALADASVIEIDGVPTSVLPTMETIAALTSAMAFVMTDVDCCATPEGRRVFCEGVAGHLEHGIAVYQERHAEHGAPCETININPS